MPPSLEDPRRKYERARTHYEPLTREIEAFEQSHPYRIRCEVDKDQGKYTFYVNDLAATGMDWGVRMGDLVHNLRSALDHLAVQLVALCTGQDPAAVEHVDFPIYSSPGDFVGWRSSLLGGAKQPKAPVPLLPGYLARLEELQPYNAGDPSIWGYDHIGFVILPGMLERISKLDNVDKHRVIHSTWHGVELFPRKDHLPELPSGFIELGMSRKMEPLVEDAEVGSWSFKPPLPSDWQPDEMQMKRAFPLQVCFDDPSLIKGVREILTWCVVAVDGVLQLFEPVFAGKLEPPLPVTSILRSHAAPRSPYV